LAAVELAELTAADLRRKIDTGRDFVLVDALPPMVYAHSHLPGAINLPPSAIDGTVVAKRIPDRSAEIVVYCSGPDCDDAHETAKRLHELGYMNVRRYPGGKNEWKELGFPLERGGRPYLPSRR
jgi:rhodanese-related sulfurtransferase